MPNPFCHVELTTQDPDASKTFYSAIFDWKYEVMSSGDDMAYSMIHVGGGTGGGIVRPPNPNLPATWTPYVLVESVEETVAKAVALGAKVFVPRSEVPGMGYLAVLGDPQGATFALWEQKEK